MKTCISLSLSIVLLLSATAITAQDSIYQYHIDSINSPFTLQARRDNFRQYLLDKTIKETFTGPLNQYTEYKFEDATLSAIQFHIKNPHTQRGFDKMFNWYFPMDASARQTLIAGVYALYPHHYAENIAAILPNERDPKIFAMAALYGFRNDSSKSYVQKTIAQMRRQFAQSSSIPVLNELEKYLTRHEREQNKTIPPLKELFNYQHLWKQKTVYSFQRWNRDYSGICIIQYEDGSFAKDSTGRLRTFPQLARSGSGMPYFITNGNTPQGIYRIAGIRSSIDQLIGPTPNLQSVIPFQNDSLFYRGLPFDYSVPALDNYKRLLPPSWQNYAPMQESFYAGLAGRRFIVVHGSTLDPSFFKGEPFYPLTPTDGCLATAETWNPDNGQLAKSTQLDLVNAFMRTPSRMGILVVVNLDNQQRNISPEEIEMLIKNYEAVNEQH